jgi:tetratricopeptide (TPR) repeat protein
VGGAIMWGWAADRVARRLAPKLRVAVLGATLLALAAVAQPAAGAWESDRAFWTVATARAPTSARAFTGLSRAHRLAHDFDAADGAADRAIALDPAYAPAYVTRAYNALARGNPKAAKAEVERARILGGDDTPGLRRAAACLSERAEAAPKCIE